MKRFFSLLCAGLFVIFIISGCGSKNTVADNNEKKLKVVTTIFPQYDFVRQIAGEHVDLSMLLSPGSESHSYEPTPMDIVNIEKSDMFIYVGGENDKWLDKILDSIDTSKTKVVSLMDLVDTVEEETVEGMQEEDEDDGNEPEYDEHVWTSPKNAHTIVNKLSDILCELDPDNQDVYQSNTTDYASKLKALDTEFASVISTSPHKTLVFGDRFPFRYLVKEYGLKYFAAFSGCSTETEASASTVAFLIDKIKEENIPVVFYIEFSNQKMADTISESTGARKLLLHSCHNVSKTEFESGVTYLDLMKQNLTNIKEALK